VDNDFFEQIKLFLPKYLTPGQGQQLFAELKALASDPTFNKNFYWMNPSVPDLLQGDGWNGFVAVDFHTTERKQLSGVILTNSCDIDIRNPRVHQSKVLFAPLIKLLRFEELLRSAGKDDQQVADALSAIRSQTTTYIFYLPEIAGKLESSMILLDDIHAQPLSNFLETKTSRLFALSQYAFYLLLMKLSIHLSRFQEGVARY
jgi:hypothetical protein